MELEGLFSGTKWDILRLIAKEPRNPLELARVLGTSIANISQQLRLLEAAGLVRKEKVSNRERGKPVKRVRNPPRHRVGPEAGLIPPP